jgi:RNA polymerase primary sigma factor/RNA polymerase sigma factor
MIRILPHDGEKILTVEELSQSLGVSTKTISRWRRRGLVSCRFVSDGRQRVGFRKSSVESFVRQNPDRVRRGSEFSRVSNGQREEIIHRADDLARAGHRPAEVMKRLASEVGRSAETIRYILRQFDREHPERAIFPDHFGPPREETKQQIYQAFRSGQSADELATRFRRTKASIRRIVGEVRARWIAELPLDYMPNPEFDRPGADSQILGPAPRAEKPSRPVRRPKDLPPYLASLYEIPLLTPPQERYLFRKMNYLKHQASKLLAQLDPTRPNARLMDRIERFHERAVAVKNEIVRANLRLVVSIAKRYLRPGEDLFGLVSDGNMALLRAVEKFDYARGNKFSTYATWAIIKNFARSIPNEFRHRNRFRTGHDEMLLTTEDEPGDPGDLEASQIQRQGQIREILSRLSEREQKVIVRRFGLTGEREPLTLKEVGATLGVSKERARQIEARAMSKLRDAVQKESLELAAV